MKRAIVLSGGGPAVGLSLGALQRFDEEADIQFDVWSTSCIGGWLAALYNQAPEGHGTQAATDFFRKVFRPDEVYARYPVAHVFAPNLGEMAQDLSAFLMNPESYRGLVVPNKIREAMVKWAEFLMTPSSWTAHGMNDLFFNHMMAAHPVSRFITSMIYLSPVHGLSQIYYPDSEILRAIDFEALRQPGKPVIYHNAYNLTDQQIELFCNKADGQYRPITAASLCACSALPFLENTIEIDGKTYCEGAVVDAVSFANLLTDHPDIEEIWISRILDHRQIQKPNNLTEALSNLIMLFAAKMSEDDVDLFRYRLMQMGSPVRVVEIPVALNIDHSWTHSNLDHAIAEGYRAADQTIAAYRTDEDDAMRTTDDPVLPSRVGADALSALIQAGALAHPDQTYGDPPAETGRFVQAKLNPSRAEESAAGSPPGRMAPAGFTGR